MTSHWTRAARATRTAITSIGLAVSVASCGGGDSPSSPPTGAGVLSALAVTTVDSPIEIGQGTQANVEGRDSQGGTVALGSRTITWTSSNTSIVTVDNAGRVAGVGVGQVTLNASAPNGSATVTGSVNLTVTGIPGAATTSDVAMAPQLFVPSETIIKLGGTVRFIFTPIDHNVIWNPRKAGSPTDILVTTNATVSRTFPTVGVYPFDCTVHPGMSGRVIVTP